ncbi:MAG: AAA family ATPase [Deltaproteobacteria bacterium]|nr:AAA family ATPase [Deltaproteobacteria bacterium]
MECPTCRTENPEGIKFCGECGARLQRNCPQCHAVNPPQFKFCGECGQVLDKPPLVFPIDYRQPQSYTPKHLAEKILNGRSTLDGERKLVTVMFADVAGFTSLSEKLDPEDVHRIMDGCCRILVDEIHRFEGTVGEFRGDGVMALFGAPIAHEDHARRACLAALAIQQALVPYGEEIKRTYGIDFRMRLGLNSGTVVVGAIGDDLRMDYTAMGDTTNLAARMETAAKPGSVLVSASTHRLAREFFEFAPPDTLLVKGKQEPVEAFRLLSPTEVGTRIGASVARGLTRFVGRSREIETLREAFAKVQSGAGQVVGLVGEAGVGKSRLLLEFRSLLPQEGYTYLEGQCLHYGGSMPYLPILDVLRSFLGVKEGEPEQVIRQRLKERILNLDENLRDLIPPFQELLSLQVEDEAYGKLEPKKKREKTFEALRDLLIRGTRERPLVLAVEDLQWIDKTTEEFLTYMIGWLPRTRILLLLLYRPEYVHQWGSKSYYSMIGVGQLSSGASAELVGSILEGGEVVPELQDLILNRAAGNPLFMEELTQSLLQNGSIRKTGDRFLLTRDVSSTQVPDTVQGIIAARMDRLEESLKRIMQVAAVIGREFAFRILETITEMKENLKSGLLNLQGLEFIYEKRLFPHLEYIFRHALVQEVAYNSLLIQRRKEIHEKIGRAIEQLYPERLEEFCEMLAYHYSKSGNPAQAYLYLKKSAEKAVRNYAVVEAVRFYREALEVLDQLPPSEENQREQIALVLSMRIPWARIGYSEDYLPLLQKAEALAEALGDEKKSVHIRTVLGSYFIVRGGDPQLGWKYLDRSLEDSEIIQDVDLLIPVGVALISHCTVSGDYQRVNQMALTIIRLIEHSGTQAEFYGMGFNPYAQVLSTWGMSRAMCGDPEYGERLCEKALSFAREIDHLPTLVGVEFSYGFFLNIKEGGERAISHLQRAIKYMEESQSFVFLGYAWGSLGWAHLLMGQTKMAVELAEKGLRIHIDQGLPYFRSGLHLYCSGSYFMDGDLERARTQAELALQFALQNNERHIIGMSRIWLGMAISRIDPTQIEAAEQQILQGIGLHEELGLPPLFGLGYMFLGEVCAASGRSNEALEHLKKAEALFEKMGMEYWLGKTREVLAKSLGEDFDFGHEPNPGQEG